MVDIYYTDEIIHIKADELLNNNDITLYNTIDISGAPLTLLGNIVA